MRPTYHVMISGGVSAVLAFWIQSWGAVWACFLSGIFIDLDHHWDYWLIKKELPLSYKKLVDFSRNHQERKMYLFFHSYELIFLLWVSIYYFDLNLIWLGVAVGVTTHILCDEFTNPMKPLAYFLIYRMRNRFQRKLLVKKSILSGLLIVWGLSLLFSSHIYAQNASSDLLFSKGETIHYDIKKLKLTVGEAMLVFNGTTEVAGQEVLWITFRAQGFKFLDEEQIYLDPETFFPLLIKRNLNIFGKEEKIVEFYDTHRGKVRIVKTVKDKTTEQIIENGKRFDNIYGFIYRTRQSGRFQKNEEISLHLPTSDMRFHLVEKNEICDSANFGLRIFFSSKGIIPYWLPVSSSTVAAIMTSLLSLTRSSTRLRMTSMQLAKFPLSSLAPRP